MKKLLAILLLSVVFVLPGCNGGGANNYTTYNIGATYTTHGFAIDLRYVGNSESDLVLFSPTEVTDNTVLLTLKRSL